MAIRLKGEDVLCDNVLLIYPGVPLSSLCLNSLILIWNLQAGRAGLRGTFRAFLSSGERSLENIVRYRDRDLPVVNMKGEVLYSAWRDIFHDPSQPLLTSQPLYSFSGKDVLNSSSWATKYIWHGAGQEWGADLSPRGTCDHWRTASPLAVGLASKIGTQASNLLAPQRVHCNKELVVLCIESTSPSALYARKKRSTSNTMQLKHSLGEELSSGEYQELLDLIDEDRD